jgi:hypothetical protein
LRLAGRLGPIAATFALGAAGLFVPGPAGDVAGFVWLGVFPGLAWVRLLLPGAPAATRWTLGVVLAPFAASVFGWALLQSGQPLPAAARLVAVGSWLLFASGEARALVEPAAGPGDAPASRAAWAWAVAAAAFVALPLLASPWVRVRSDTWVHAGIVWEIATRGVWPEDPRLAGHPLAYVWFYNLFIALASSLRADPRPFTTMATANVVWIGAQVWLAWQLSWLVWREHRTARPALPLLLTGLNAGALLLWPLWFLRAFRGEVRGAAEVARIWEGAAWDRTDVLYQLRAPFAWMVNSWDKFTIGTALGYAYLLLLVSLWAGGRWLAAGREERPEGSPPAWRWLLVAACAAAGMMLFHSVVGLSAVPVGIAACAALALLGAGRRELADPRRALALAGALAAGLALTLPYFRMMMRGWQADRSGFEHHYLRFGWEMPWTLVTACGLAAWAAMAGVRRVVAEGRVAGVWLVAWTAAMVGFALFVHLPESNEVKFVWQVFAPLAILGAAGLPGLLAAWRARLGRIGAALAVGVAFVLPSALFLRGFLADPSAAAAPETRRAPGDRDLYAWVRSATPARAVFVDNRSRDVLLVEGRRRLLAGTPHPAERTAFSVSELARRREVMADLFGPATGLDRDVELLDALGAPVYVLYRIEDFPDAAPWTALEADSARFERVYATPTHRVYRRRP